MKVLAVSQHPILIRGLEAVLGASAEWEIVAFGGAPGDIVDVARCEDPDVVLIDFDPAEHFGPVLDIREKIPHSRIVLWCREISLELAYQSLKAGVRGILRASVADKQLLNCLASVHAGGIWCDDDFKAAFFNAKTAVLSPRESQLVVLISQGLKNKEIAGALSISESTVRIYLSSVFRRLGVKDRYELAIYGFKAFMQNSRISAAAIDPASLPANQSADIRFLMIERPRPKRQPARSVSFSPSVAKTVAK